MPPRKPCIERPRPDKSGWRPIETAPTDRPFLAAEYRPTAWAYHVKDVDPRRFVSPRHREINLEYCKWWMERPAPPQEPSS